MLPIVKDYLTKMPNQTLIHVKTKSMFITHIKYLKNISYTIKNDITYMAQIQHFQEKKSQPMKA